MVGSVAKRKTEEQKRHRYGEVCHYWEDPGHGTMLCSQKFAFTYHVFQFFFSIKRFWVHTEV